MSLTRTPADKRRLEELAKHLRSMRELRGWSRATLARAAGLGVATIKNTERAKYTPTRASLVRLLDALQLPEEEQRQRLLELLPTSAPRCPTCERILVCPSGCKAAGRG